jgi:hypothetical protein
MTKHDDIIQTIGLGHMTKHDNIIQTIGFGHMPNFVRGRVPCVRDCFWSNPHRVSLQMGLCRKKF